MLPKFVRLNLMALVSILIARLLKKETLDDIDVFMVINGKEYAFQVKSRPLTRTQWALSLVKFIGIQV